VSAAGGQNVGLDAGMAGLMSPFSAVTMLVWHFVSGVLARSIINLPRGLAICMERLAVDIR